MTQMARYSLLVREGVVSLLWDARSRHLWLSPLLLVLAGLKGDMGMHRSGQVSCCRRGKVRMEILMVGNRIEVLANWFLWCLKRRIMAGK
jgi:hypothetical protein